MTAARSDAAIAALERMTARKLERLGLTSTGDLELDRWLAAGVDAGYIAPPACSTCEPIPMLEAELEEVDGPDGSPGCVHVLRLWPTPQPGAWPDATRPDPRPTPSLPSAP